MAVFTTFNHESLERFLSMFGLGELVSYEPIEAGIENSNYFIRVSQYEEETEYVLTIVEGLGFDDIPFFTRVISHLFNYGVPVAAPKQTLDGMTMTIFCGKPALLFPKLPGSHSKNVDTDQCFSVGIALADMHKILATETGLTRANAYNPDWMHETLTQVEGKLDVEDFTLLEQLAYEYSNLHDLENLPTGVIHGDLFRDNVLFHEGSLAGIIDFYHACEDFLIQDLAITINDWCQVERSISSELMLALIAGYESKRPLEATEREFLPHFQRAACARFALTRLMSGDESGHLKDPAEFISLARTLKD